MLATASLQGFGPLLLQTKMCILFGPTPPSLDIYTHMYKNIRTDDIVAAASAGAHIWKLPPTSIQRVWIKSSRPTQSVDGRTLITKEASCPDGKRGLKYIVKLKKQKKASCPTKTSLVKIKDEM